MEDCGIYMVTNPINEVYIGASRSLENRKQHYRYRPFSFSRPIDVSLRKYGADGHVFTILEYCDERFLSNMENFYIQYMKFLGFSVLNVGNSSPNKRNPRLIDTHPHHRARSIGRIIKRERKSRGYSKNFVCDSCNLTKYELKEIEEGFGRYSFESLIAVTCFYGFNIKVLHGLFDLEELHEE